MLVPLNARTIVWSNNVTTDNAHAAPATAQPSGKDWLITVLLGLSLAGIGLLVVSTYIVEYEVLHHLVRDVAIALLVSALVTYCYEGYLRKRVDFEKLESVLRTVAGSSIPAT